MIAEIPLLMASVCKYERGTALVRLVTNDLGQLKHLEIQQMHCRWENVCTARRCSVHNGNT